jgi:dCTP deaminase
MTFGILSDSAIQQAIETGDITIDPFNREQLNPASYDLTLGSEVKVYADWVEGDWNPPNTQVLIPNAKVLDIKNELKTITLNLTPDDGMVLYPQIGYLMHTQERVCSLKYNPVLDGKSSIARLFIQVHAAGYGDIGFDGNYTLEVTVVHPIRVYPGMRIAQMRFHTISGDVQTTYNKVGHYTGIFSKGAVASQAYKQFR